MVLDTHPSDARTGRFPWQIAVLFVAIAAISRAPALIVLAFGAVVAWLVVEITGRLALSAVDARVTLTPDRIIAGELPIATIELANRKPLPLPWLEARLFLGEGVEPLFLRALHAAAAEQRRNSGPSGEFDQFLRRQFGHRLAPTESVR